jgi:osmoprotectant transport system permease protein
VSFWEFLSARSGTLVHETVDHASLVFQCMLTAAVIGVGVAMLSYRRRWASTAALTFGSVMLTIPSFALLGLLIFPLGLGVRNAFVALVLYALLPILRNAIVGLCGVDPALVDSARGMGMGRVRILLKVELPMAWPVILTGIRVSTQLILGIAAIAAYVRGPGLGREIFAGLSRLGSVNSLNQALAGTLGVVLLAVVFDLFYVAVRRLTTSRGLRA